MQNLQLRTLTVRHRTSKTAAFGMTATQKSPLNQPNTSLPLASLWRPTVAGPAQQSSWGSSGEVQESEKRTEKEQDIECSMNEQIKRIKPVYRHLLYFWKGIVSLTTQLRTLMQGFDLFDVAYSWACLPKFPSQHNRPTTHN